MARNTLPAIDPLAQLGIGVAETHEDETEPKRERPALRTARHAEQPTVDPAEKTPDKPSQELSDATQEATPDAAPKHAPARAPRARPTLRAEPSPGPTPLKVKFNARIPPELADEVRDCVVALYSAHGLTIDGIAAEALRREIERLKKQLNGGQDFPKRVHAPKPGRPVR